MSLITRNAKEYRSRTAKQMSQNLPKRSFRDFLSLRHPNCFAFRPQPALPRKLDSVNLVPRGYFRLYKRPRGIRQRKD